MSVLVVTPPDPLVTLAEAKAHLRRLDGEEDAYIMSLVAAASAFIDGPYGIVKRAVGRQTLEVRSHVFSGICALPLGPVESITSVKYIDVDGAEQTVPDATYYLTDERFGLMSGAVWPRLRGDANGVRVQYLAGFDPVPEPIKQAALLLVSQWFMNRSAVAVGSAVNDMPNGVKALLWPYKVIRV